MSLPFSSYDFFGYLAAGVLLLCAGVVSADYGSLLLQSQPASVILLGTITAYIAGHAVAHLSSTLLEHALTRGWIGAPEGILLHGSKSNLWRGLLPGYSAPLSSELATQVSEKAIARGWGRNDRTVFLRASTLVRRDPVIGARLDHFLNLYGFCRNCSMALLLGTVAIAVSAGLSRDSTRLWLACGCFMTAVLLFLRYLKFYRLYTVEVLLASTETT